MLKKVLQVFFGLCFWGGIIFILGTAGASDLDRIGFGTMVVRCGISLIVSVVGFFGLKLTGCEYID